MTDTGSKDLEKQGENIPGFLAPSSQVRYIYHEAGTNDLTNILIHTTEYY